MTIRLSHRNDLDRFFDFGVRNPPPILNNPSWKTAPHRRGSAYPGASRYALRTPWRISMVRPVLLQVGWLLCMVPS